MWIERFTGARVESELGVEQCCRGCGEYWPADAEFFAPQASGRDGLTPRCRACIAERCWGLRAPPQAASWSR